MTPDVRTGPLVATTSLIGMESRSSARRSAGLLLYRSRPAGTEVLLVHPGGPVWVRRDLGAWSVPKGEYEPGEEPVSAARREFAEEVGGDLDAGAIHSNTFEMEWPPRSGRRAEFPEVDRAEWFALDEAREKINPAQVALLDRLRDALPS
jgi:predicted NUDIX family NTP pyrophosphohydrolase